MRIKGKIKWYNVKNGYGFIAGEDGQDYFVHFTAIDKEAKIYENDEVEFDAADTERGKQAQNVVKIGEGQPAPTEAPAELSEAEAPVEEQTQSDSEDF